MQKWEYLRVQVVYGKDAIDSITSNGEQLVGSTEGQTKLHEYFMKLGLDGWELVSECLGAEPWVSRFTFKRPIE